MQRFTITVVSRSGEFKRSFGFETKKAFEQKLRELVKKEKCEINKRHDFIGSAQAELVMPECN